MSEADLISLIARPITWLKPLRLALPNAWIGHIPLAYWLIEALKPSRLVELGTHSGNSYLAFLQAVDASKMSTQCFAVDTWRGDKHAGEYDDSVFDELSRFHNPRYQSFSRLVRSTFDEALPSFEDGSIDLLHIDGLHTYDAVRHDFESWLPKLSDRAVVLFHDINVRENHFGVWKLWGELEQRYPGIAFHHSHGLGILLVGSNVATELGQLHALMAGDPDRARVARNYFSSLGAGLLDHCEILSTQEQLNDMYRVAIDTGTHLDAAHTELNGRRAESAAFDAKIAQRDAELRNAREQATVLGDENGKLLIRVGELGRKNSELGGKVGELGKQISELGRRIEDLGNELKAAAGFRDAALRSYARLASDRFVGRLARIGVAVPGGTIQRLDWKGYHRLALLLILLRHPFDRSLRKNRYAAIRERHRQSEILRDLFVAGPAVRMGLSSWLDIDYYLARNPDVQASGQEPERHFLEWGAFQDRAHHAMFDVGFYRQRAEALGEAVGESAFVHYLERGGGLRIDPHPLFDTAYYLGQLGEHTANCPHPLLHYLTLGQWLDLSPNPDFDPHWYASQNPDVIAQGLPSFLHYVMYGQREGRAASAASVKSGTPGVPAIAPERLKVFETHRFAPSGALPPIVPSRTVDVIIPVYGGPDETRRCVRSVIKSASQNGTLGRVIVVDDRGPDPAMRRMLDEFRREPRLSIVENERNLGFVESVNRGMQLAERNDALLLNSDTEVVNDWLDRIAAQAYAAPDIGTVTPFSNNATICSYPLLQGSSRLPAGETLESLDDAFRAANARRSVDIPTAVGFCMYIKRACLDETGLFDVATFGKGYGEENDFCMRSAKLGWRHILAGDVFVFHVGEVSFSEGSKAGKDHAWTTLTRLYPEYAPSIARFVERDPVEPLRAAATSVLHKTSGLPVVLHILHRIGGGTARHVYDIARLQSASVRNLVLEIAAMGDTFEGRIVDFIKQMDIAFVAQDIDELAEMLAAFGVSRIHIHHVFSFADHIDDLLIRMRIPYDLTVHDYMMICPKITLTNRDGVYCGEPDEQGCLSCLTSNAGSLVPEESATVHDIIWWRLRGRTLINGASRVFCPSQDVADRLKRYALFDNLMVVPHEVLPPRLVHVPDLPPGEPLRIAVLGAMSGHKGASFLIACAQSCTYQALDVVITVIGDFEKPKVGAEARAAGIRVTGGYQDQDLQRLIAEHDPHLLFYPQRWPETYSYTLSAGLLSGRPILAPSIGAFIERLKGEPWVWRFDIGTSASDLAEEFRKIRDRVMQDGPIEGRVDPDRPLSPNAFYLSHQSLAAPVLGEALGV